MELMDAYVYNAPLEDECSRNIAFGVVVLFLLSMYMTQKLRSPIVLVKEVAVDSFTWVLSYIQLEKGYPFC